MTALYHTNFCCRSGGNNLNAGTLDGSTTEASTTPQNTYVGGDYNGSTGVYTAPVGADLTFATSGKFMSVCADGDTNPTTNQFVIGRITAANPGARTITIGSRLNYGTAMGTTTGNRTARIGGAWKGPNGAIGFPFGFIGGTLTDVNVSRPRINYKNDQTYAITAAMTHNIQGPILTQGYTTTYGDGGQAVIDGGTSGVSYVLFTNNNAQFISFENVTFQNNGASAGASLVDHISGGNAHGNFVRCVFSNSMGTGLNLANGTLGQIIECEAFACNKSNTANLAGFAANTMARFTRCISHHHTSGVNGHGFISASWASFINCIAADNFGSGIKTTTGAPTVAIGCDFYSNLADGFTEGGTGGAASVLLENCNFFKNGTRGVGLISGPTTWAYIVNCAFGTGTMANPVDISYTIGTDIVDFYGSFNYPANEHPWKDPNGGDFTLVNKLANNAGRGKFLQTYASYSAPNTLGYPDIGAAAHQDMSVQPTYGVGI